MAEKSEDLDTLRQAMQASIDEIKRAQARSREQAEMGYQLNTDLMSSVTSEILKIADMAATIEALDQIRGKSPLSDHLSPHALHFSIMVSMLMGSVALHFVHNTKLTPDKFQEQLPKLSLMLGDLFSLNYAWREKQKLENPEPDDEG